MPTIFIDGKPVEIQGHEHLLESLIELGLNVPYFCWHPALGSVGACRQCAVTQYKDEHDTEGRIVMSCMTPAVDGMRVAVDDEASKAFRASVIEWMMTNHPHDCPVCDEGGECHLQDMTLMTGHTYRKYRFEKKTYVNQDLGPLVNHEMNRCIECYRCVRYYKDFAGGKDLDVFASHNHVYFGRREDGTLESEFSGNLVEVCPTGVFTDKTLKKHFTRRWDYTTAPSVCVHCALGCNITPGERYGELRRIRNRYNRDVNGYFLCDRGRYGYEFVNAPRRPKQPMLRVGGRDGRNEFREVTREEAMAELGALVRDGGPVIGIGSPRASLEANFALRLLVGAENFFLGLSKDESALMAATLEAVLHGPARQPSLGEIPAHDAVLILGEDLTNVAPLAALHVRQTILNRPRAKARALGIADWNVLPVARAIDGERGPVHIATPYGGKLDDIATTASRQTPHAIARLGFAVAHAIAPDAPDPGPLDAETQALAARIAGDLLAADRPLVVSGPSCDSVEVIRAAANVAWALCRQGRTSAGLFYTAHESNSVGLEMMGGGHLEDAARAITTGRARAAIVLENDLYRRADARLVDEMIATASKLVVVDHTMTPTAIRADVVLPAATFAEGAGTLVNNVGSAQRFIEVLRPEGEITESWRWLRRINTAAGRSTVTQWIDLDSFLKELADELPVFARIVNVAPPASFRVGGRKIPRQSHRFSGRTAMKANIAVSEAGVAPDLDSPMSFSMEGFPRMTPARLMASFWTPGWNSAQAITRFQEEVNGPLEGGDPGIRLIEPAAEVSRPYYMPQPPVAATDGRLLAIERLHIFGSEELSRRAPGVAALAPSPYVLLHPDDAKAAGLGDGDTAEVAIEGQPPLRLPVVCAPAIARGVMALPRGIDGVPFVPLPSPGRVRRPAEAS
jgi:NADH-quinone oxidoreductase subunit G